MGTGLFDLLNAFAKLYDNYDNLDCDRWDSDGQGKVYKSLVIYYEKLREKITYICKEIYKYIKYFIYRKCKIKPIQKYKRGER